MFERFIAATERRLNLYMGTAIAAAFFLFWILKFLME